jgi:hypothetical protein
MSWGRGMRAARRASYAIKVIHTEAQELDRLRRRAILAIEARARQAVAA